MQRKKHHCVLSRKQTKPAKQNDQPPGIKFTPLTQIGIFARFKSSNTFHFNFGEAKKDATCALQTLHHLGTMLINSGKAYSDIKNGEPLPNSPQSDEQHNMKQRLLNIYNALPLENDAMIIDKRVQTAEKILHALFVIRIALDHLPASELYQLYLAYNKQNTNGLKIFLHSFADGSGLLGSFAAEQLLFRYICLNPNKFLFISTEDYVEMLSSENSFTDYFCIGGEDKKDAVNNIMHDATPYMKKAHENSITMTHDV